MYGGSGVFLAGVCDGHLRFSADVHENPHNDNPLELDSLKIEGFYVDRVQAIRGVVHI